jgi:hypothetical protein
MSGPRERLADRREAKTFAIEAGGPLGVVLDRIAEEDA